MSTLEIRETLEGPFEADEPLDALVDFYRANGYERSASDASPPRALDGDDPSPEDDRDTSSVIVLARGESGAGWWSSDMTDLRATVSIERIAPSEDPEDEAAGAVRVAYEIETTGQYVTEDDRDFWRRELEEGRRCLTSASSDEGPSDLRPMEHKRAKQMGASRLRYALWGAFATFGLVVVLRTMGCL